MFTSDLPASTHSYIFWRCRNIQNQIYLYSDREGSYGRINLAWGKIQRGKVQIVFHHSSLMMLSVSFEWKHCSTNLLHLKKCSLKETRLLSNVECCSLQWARNRSKTFLPGDLHKFRVFMWFNDHHTSWIRSFKLADFCRKIRKIHQFKVTGPIPYVIAQIQPMQLQSSIVPGASWLALE